ncbi:hypothetical protein [Cellvibrio sp. PSBB023]|uniref:hypothetical protein n=1 Tax=Cellvibrio sp. PSBB023 TaxID=1945512 RepID=UPI00098EDE23|nr:hypothetical protein [Cellvibrio sp. PSBB023]AQT60811.1 hypothetical protein B0D95_12510 [Cellvibrio sp. PSBB023]
MEYIAILEKFFLQNLFGVLLLGALGSILGVGILSVGRRLIRFLSEHKEYFYLRILYKFIFVPYEIGSNFTKLISPSNDAKYIIYYIAQLIEVLILFFISLSLFIVGSFIILLHGIEKPYLLSFIASIFFLTFFGWFNLLVRCVGFLSREHHDLMKKIKSEQPKSFKEYLEQ